MKFSKKSLIKFLKNELDFTEERLSELDEKYKGRKNEAYRYWEGKEMLYTK